jgi:hypothetical protein
LEAKDAINDVKGLGLWGLEVVITLCPLWSILSSTIHANRMVQARADHVLDLDLLPSLHRDPLHPQGLVQHLLDRLHPMLSQYQCALHLLAPGPVIRDGADLLGRCAMQALPKGQSIADETQLATASPVV